jgi:hypothetical protein
MSLNPLVVNDYPDPAGVPIGSDAAKVESVVKKWSREVAQALRSVYSTAQAAAPAAAVTRGGRATNTPVVQFPNFVTPPPKAYSLLLDMAVLNSSGLTSFLYGVDISGMKLGSKPSAALGVPQDSLPSIMVAAYDWANPLTLKTVAQFMIYNVDGSALPSAGTRQVGFIIFP